MNINELYSLQGRVALVTGATGYLGSQMVWALAEAGAHVLINSRREQTAQALVDQLQAQSLSAEAAVFDITDEAAVAAYFASYKGDRLHVLINNAYAGGAGSLEHASDDDYRQSYDVAVVAAQRLQQQALPLLRQAVAEDGDASVINIASMYGLVSPDQRIYASKAHVNPPFYGAAKAALVQLTRYGACELGAEGIRVNAISPGPFPTEQVQQAAPEFIETLSGKVPMGRIGKSTELKGPVLFLASRASSFVNGANLRVDGGWTCW